MKRFPLLLICLCGFILPGKNFAQNSVVSGKVYNQENKVLPQAIVALFKQKDSALVKVMLTDKNGNYRFENLDGEKFMLEISKPGLEPMKRKFEVGEGEEKELREFIMVNVKKGTEEKSPLLVQSDDKFLMDIEGSGVMVKGNAWDVIKTAPNVTENADGFLCFNGRQLMIEIDGKQSELSRQGLKNKIKQIKAEDVSGLEIRNDGKNSDGKPVINLVTMEGSKNGFYGEVTSGNTFGKTNQTEDGFEFNYKKGNVNVFGSYDFSQKPTVEKSTYATSFLYEGTNVDYLDKELETKKPLEHDAALGFDFNGDKGFSFGMNFSAEQIREKGTESDLSQYTLPGDTLLFNKSYGTENNDAVKIANVHIAQLVRPMGAKFSADYTFANDISNWSQGFPVEQPVDGTGNSNPEAFRRFVGGRNYSISKGEFKYVQRISDNIFTIAGVKSNLTNSKSDFTSEFLNNGNWENEGILDMNYGFKQRVNDAYLIGKIEVGKFSIATAFEAQQAISTGLSQATEYGKQKSGVSLIPSLVVDQQLNARNLIEYSFTQTLSRPSFKDLDPTAQYNNSYSYTIGNPNLRPEITNNMEIEYTLGSFLSLSAAMDITKNGIQRVSYTDDAGTIFYTKENLSKSNETTFGITGLLPIGNSILFKNEFNMNFSTFEAQIYGMNINSNTHSFTASSILQIELPAGFILNVNGAYASASTNGLMQMDARGVLNSSVSKSILKDNLKLEVGVNDILNTGSINVKYLTQDGMYTYHVFSQGPTLEVNAKYVFGNVKAKREE
jgi:iron complex outermembrane receptor protein